MINIGINGFGRIGKCVFLQLLNNPKFSIKCINVLNISITEIEDYLKYDSTHKYNNTFKVDIISNTELQINQHIIKLFSDRNAKNINWKKYNCNYLIDATGSYLTTEKCLDHNVDYIIMSSPPKDKTPSFIFGANHEKYNGEKIISGSSCTTNCIAPMLKILNDEYIINNCVFTTIHATTASQYTVDIVNKSSRTNRSILNNIIPHTTGASSSIINVLPELNGKINGTSIRVPVSNGSLLDLNIELENKNITLNDVKNLLLKNKHFKTVFDINEKKLVSCDFITTTTPTILDINASIDMGNGKFKLMIWYDNEWSYSAQLINLIEYIQHLNTNLNPKYYFENIDMTNKGVVCRLDFNVPVKYVKELNSDNLALSFDDLALPFLKVEIIDDFRFTSSLKTINTILSKNPKYLILTSHFGRPKNKESKYSLRFLIPILEKYLERKVNFLPLEKVDLNNYSGVYLLENLRFNEEETNYLDDLGLEKLDKVDFYKNLGDVFICDAFGCVHRNHLSICAIKNFGKPYGYGHLIKQEVDMIDSLINNPTKKILGIIGGNKIKDKLPIIDSLKLIKNSTIYIAQPLKKTDPNFIYVENLDLNVKKMHDGYGNINLDLNPIYIENIENCSNSNIYDIGRQSLNDLFELVDNSDIIFWNGPIGVIEHDVYKFGSVKLMNYLNTKKDKIIIIGGGDCGTLVKKTHQNMYKSSGGGALLEYLQNKIINKKLIVGLEIYI
jgi:glyceraldehyde 3-phosphate dehydrogenase